MKVIFMGTPEISAIILKKLLDEKYDIIAVVTQPDKPKGRGKEMACSEVKQVALKAGLPIYQPVRARAEEFVGEMRALKPDVMVVAAFGQILSQELLDVPTHCCVNVHTSLLPKYRGAAPIQQAVIDGEEVTGVTIQRMDAGIDTGDIILQHKVSVDPKETGGSLYDKLAAAGAEAIVEALKQIEDGTAVYTQQDHSLATHVGKLTKELGNINFNQSAVTIERLIRGLNPWPSAYTQLDGKTLKIWEANVITDPELIKEAKEYSVGTIVKTDKASFYVKTSDGLLQIMELQLEGKKRMAAGDFLRGYNLTVGTILG